MESQREVAMMISRKGLEEREPETLELGRRRPRNNVKEVKGKQVRLGIVAPRDVYVCREELYERIHQANVGATAADVNLLDSISGLFKKQGGSSNAD